MAVRLSQTLGVSSMPENLVTKAELHSHSGAERLRLLYVERLEGGDFHSLSFEVRDSDEWKPVAVIARDQFQLGHPTRRWVADLHSFSPAFGTAIIQVAEGDRPKGSYSIHFIYSWRRWNLHENQQIALLKECKSPFDQL
jgi:hypothetical protein